MKAVFSCAVIQLKTISFNMDMNKQSQRKSFGSQNRIKSNELKWCQIWFLVQFLELISVILAHRSVKSGLVDEEADKWRPFKFLQHWSDIWRSNFEVLTFSVVKYLAQLATPEGHNLKQEFSPFWSRSSSRM